jgi:hypothetical protein
MVVQFCYKWSLTEFICDGTYFSNPKIFWSEFNYRKVLRCDEILKK